MFSQVIDSSFLFKKPCPIVWRRKDYKKDWTVITSSFMPLSVNLTNKLCKTHSLNLSAKKINLLQCRRGHCSLTQYKAKKENGQEYTARQQRSISLDNILHYKSTPASYIYAMLVYAANSQHPKHIHRKQSVIILTAHVFLPLSDKQRSVKFNNIAWFGILPD